LSTAVHQPETDLIVPLPNGERWDPHTIHTHYFGLSVPEAQLGAFIYVRYQPAFPLCQGGVCIFRGFDNVSPLDIDFLDYQLTMPWANIEASTITTANGLRIEFLEPGRTARVTYCSNDGRVRRAPAHEVFAALRLAITMHHAGNLMIDAWPLPLHAPWKLNDPASQQLADLPSLPAPDGAVPSFVGNR
jgi:hypothetical protein